ncbi:MAG: leucyl/phenylalanyl-tRNA--protein transferase [Sediminicola sp.]
MKGDQEPGSLYFVSERLEFPPVENANEDGLLAVGGDLSPERLLLAYKSGIFPWFNMESPVLWWSPDPRMVLFPHKIKISKSMSTVLRSEKFKLTKNSCFEKVMQECAQAPRKGQEGTWITDGMLGAYNALHALGVAESYEVWEGKSLVGGLYGINLGHVFCRESMFSKVSNASKFAFINLARELWEKGYGLLDCQIYTSHLESLGAERIPRKTFIEILKGEN